jgi:hypothetical protein
MPGQGGAEKTAGAISKDRIVTPPPFSFCSQQPHECRIRSRRLASHPARRPARGSFPSREKAENKLPANPFGKTKNQQFQNHPFLVAGTFSGQWSGIAEMW